MNTTKYWVGALVILLAAFGIYAYTHQESNQRLAGYTPGSGISGQTGLNLTYQTNQNGATSTPTIDPNGGFVQNGNTNIVTAGTFSEQSGQVVTNGVYPNTLNFNGTAIKGTTYEGTTTLFAIQNPFGATSTVTFAEIIGQGATSSLTLSVGTSTLPFGISTGGLIASNISPSLINTTVSTSSSIFTVSGATAGPIAGFQSAGSASLGRIVVGPYDYIVGFATTTSGAAANTYLPGITGALSTLAGSYSVKWER